MRKKIKKYILPIILVILILAGIMTWINSTNLSDFGLNFATEIIGVLITVYIVDYFIKLREELRVIPLKIIAYQEVSVLNNRFLGLIFDLYDESVRTPAPKTTKEFIQKEYIQKAFLHTSIYGEPKVDPPQTMANYLCLNAQDFEIRAEKILDKYSKYLPPQIAISIHKSYVESPLLNVMKTLPKIVEFRKNLQFPESLLYYLPNIGDKDKKYLIKINEWLIKERKKLLSVESDLRELRNPEGLSKRPNNRDYRYEIPEEKLVKQINEFNKNRNKN